MTAKCFVKDYIMHDSLMEDVAICDRGKSDGIPSEKLEKTHFKIKRREKM